MSELEDFNDILTDSEAMEAIQLLIKSLGILSMIS